MHKKPLRNISNIPDEKKKKSSNKVKRRSLNKDLKKNEIDFKIKDNFNKRLQPLSLKGNTPYKLNNDLEFFLTSQEKNILELIELDQKHDISMEFAYRKEIIEKHRKEHFLFLEMLEKEKNNKSNEISNKSENKENIFPNKSPENNSNSKKNSQNNPNLIENSLENIFCNPDYMNYQPDLSWSHRSFLNSWLIEISYNLGLLPESLFLAVHLCDRFLSKRYVTQSKYQLVGLTALLIASKYEEIEPPIIENFIEMINTDNKTLLKAEKYFLMTLNFNIEFNQPLEIIRYLSSVTFYNKKIRILAKYLLEITLIKNIFLKFSNYIKSLSCFYLSRKILNETSFCNIPFYLLKINKENIKKCCNEILFVLKEKDSIYESIKKKYSTKKNCLVSVFVEEFAEKHLRK